MASTPTDRPAASRLHADMDPLRERLGLRPRRAPLTPPPLGGPTPPSQPPPPHGPAVAAAPGPQARSTPTRGPSGSGAPGTARPGRALTALEEAGDAATEGVRTLAHSPAAAAFGVAQRLASSGRTAARGAARRRSVALSLRRPGPDLIVERTLFETGLAKSDQALLVTDHEESDDPAGVGGGGATPDEPHVGSDWHPGKAPRSSRGRP